MARPKSKPCAVCGSKAHPDGIRHLPSKRYQARFLGPDARRYTKTFQTTKDARAWLSGQHTDISSGKFEQAKVKASTAVAFAEYAERWVKGRKVKGRALSPRTVSGYHDLLDRFILPTFGRLPIHTITKDDVDAWYNETATDRPTYQAKAYGLLRTILGSAVDDGYLSLNPARVRGGGQVERAHEVKPATREELIALTESMPERYRLLVQLAAWCAMRFGELTELRRSDIDTKAGVIRIRRAVVLVNGEFIVKDPKSLAGSRNVHVPAALMPMVREHLLRHTAAGPSGLLFSARDDENRHLRQSSLTRVYYPARAKAGRPDLRFHDLRHTGAVMAAQTGATMAELMARLGHSTSQAAMRYQHAAEDRDAIIAARLSDTITGTTT